MIADNIHSILSELPQGVRLVAVSKFHPVSALEEAYSAGQRVFGENRPQEFAAKVPQMPSDVEWHFIGHLQTNKLKLVLPYAALVESVDSIHLLDAIDKWALENGRSVEGGNPVNILLELHLGAEETKSGLSEEEILSVCRAISASVPQVAPSLGGPSFVRRTDHLQESDKSDPSHKWAPPASVPRVARPLGGQSYETDNERPGRSYSGVRIRGLMGMATNTDDETVIRADFERIARLKRRINEEFPSLVDFTELSIGMSSDWRIAVEYGATLVRIGSAIFGPRSY